jgi:hypothetical protein
MFVIRTDAVCNVCGDRHDYVTSHCDMIVYPDRKTAEIDARRISGSTVAEILEVPRDVSVKLDVRLNGRRNPALPAGINKL